MELGADLGWMMGAVEKDSNEEDRFHNVNAMVAKSHSITGSTQARGRDSKTWRALEGDIGQKAEK